jgi:S-formylglutathione hydrolase FrmB
MTKWRWSVVWLILLCAGAGSADANTASARFEVTIARAASRAPQRGRLFIFLSKDDKREPRTDTGNPTLTAWPMFAKDVDNFVPASTVAVIDNTSMAHPMSNLSELPAGEYFVQALLDTNIDSAALSAPGNLYSPVQKLMLDPKSGFAVKLELSKVIPPEELPAETDYVKYVKIRSDLLTRFFGRPIFLRGGIILPRDYDRESTRRYPLHVRIGGFASRFSRAGQLMEENSDFRKGWLADDTPRMIYLFLDGDGPYGDPYQVNSANNGPYGDAVTQELIPAVEKKFRAVGKPEARFLTGGSTGGWVSVALQIFYPDYFNGAWAGSPDPLDFRAYGLIDIYKDKNAYVNASRMERPTEREANGDTVNTVRIECQKENVAGAGDSYVFAGGQWGAWNAVFSPKAADGTPMPLWDPKTGAIDHEVAEQWKKYDLRLVAEQNWKTLGPKLNGKLHIWAGEADNYFLNNAVHLFEDFVSKAEPAYDGWIMYSRTGRHGWRPKDQFETMKEMQQRFERTLR